MKSLNSMAGMHYIGHFGLAGCCLTGEKSSFTYHVLEQDSCSNIK